MLAVIILGLALIGFFLYLSTLFFQLYGMEKRLDDCLRNAEVYLLKQFGEITTEQIAQRQENRKNKSS